MERTKEYNLGEIKDSIDNNSLFYIPKEKAEEFEKKSKEKGKGTIQIMTYGNHIIYLKANNSEIPPILYQSSITLREHSRKSGDLNIKQLFLHPITQVFEKLR